MDLDWITPKQAAEQWGITLRQVQILCKAGRVDGAIQVSRVWLIPRNTPKPQDSRVKSGRYVNWRKKEQHSKTQPPTGDEPKNND
jgi:hypothetical protein